MSMAEVSKLTLREKLLLMEALWNDLREHVDDMDLPASHRELLDARRQRVATGQSALHDWDQVKNSIGKS